MQRLALFLFLVVILPLAVFWTSHGFEGPAAGAGRFATEFSALGGARPPLETTPERAPEERPEVPSEEPSGTGEARPGEESPPTAPPAEEPPAPEPVESPRAAAARLFHGGRFAQAMEAYAGHDEARRALAQLGAAFVAAFPERIPPGEYLVVETTAGVSYEGFAQQSNGLVKLVEPGGKSVTFPPDALARKSPLPRDEAIERIARNVRTEGASDGLTGQRLFALIEIACSAGRPDAAAALMERAVELDERDPYFLSAVKHRVDVEHQAALYRAFMACELPRLTEETPVVSRTPKRLGNGSRANGGRRTNGTRVKSAEVRELLREAGPIREQAQRAYRAVVIAGADQVEVSEIEEALRLYDEALALYEKAVAIEEQEFIYAILSSCSRYRFQLAFWLQQREGK